MSGPTYPGLCRRLTNPSAEFIQNRVTFDGAAALAYVEEIDQFMDEPDAKEQEEKRFCIPPVFLALRRSCYKKKTDAGRDTCVN